MTRHTTWQTLTDDARAAIAEVCQAYGAALFDYCRTELAAEHAERAACGALLSAHHHADRLAEPDHLRAWLYALARAHRTAEADANPSLAWVWALPGQADSPVGQALAALPEWHREVLDLAVRHGLTDVEIALIFDAGVVEIERLLDEAADQLEAWVAAADGGCAQLADLTAEPVAAQAPRRRAQIIRHLTDCPACQAAPRTATADVLLQQVPIVAAPATMVDRLAVADPLGPDTSWRTDGFPAQDGTPAPPPGPAPARHAAPPAEDATSTGQEQEFRDWERRSRKSEEFWERRDDEADPEARLSIRPILPAVRVSVIIAAAVASVLAAGAAWSSLQPTRPSATVAPAAAPATITLLSEPPLLDPLPEDPPDPPVDQPTGQPTDRPTNVPTTAAPTHRPTRFPASRSVSPTGRPAKTAPDNRQGDSQARPTRRGGPQDPPRPTRRPSASSTTRALPKPPPPTASLSPSSLSLGADRSGSFALDCAGGSCQVTSGSGSGSVTVSGSRVSVSAPRSRPGCAPTTESGTASIAWSGTATGDGRTSAGTTNGGGTLTLSVSWTVEADKGNWIPTGSVGHVGDRQGYWSNCPNG
ncbi:hypothetical protein ACWDRB_66525 [Nonomuraea sp. NPDC003707]